MSLKRSSSVKPDAHSVRGRILIALLTASLIVGLGLWFVNWALAASSPRFLAVTTCTVDDDAPADYSTIQAAVDDPGCAVINVAMGTYVENVVITRSVVIRGAGPANTVVDGNLSDQVFSIESVSATVGLSSMHVIRGHNGPNEEGGGISNEGTLVIYDLMIVDNHAPGEYGGGIYNNGTLTLINSLVNINQAAYGGGLFNAGSAKATVINSQISGHERISLGGGIFTDGDLTVIGSEIDHNSVVRNDGCFREEGGGIYVNSGRTIIKDSLIHTNYAGHGGGMYIRRNGEVTIENSQILTNTAGGMDDPPNSREGYGGGILASGVLTITDSIIGGNNASGVLFDQLGWGGGIQMDGSLGDSESARLVMIDTDVIDNTPSGVGVGTSSAYTYSIGVEIYDSTINNNDGYGMLSVKPIDLLHIRNSQINGNSGTGIQHRGTLTLTHSQVNNNGFGGIKAGDRTIIKYSTINDNIRDAAVAADGGGIDTDGYLEVISSAVSGNTSSSCGGGIYGHWGVAGPVEGATVKLYSSTVSDNSTGTDGGGIYIDYPDSVLTVAHSTVSGNSAGRDGGGIHVYGVEGSSSLTMTYSVVNDNSADEDGGGVALIGPWITATLDSVTVANNTSGERGGGIYSFWTLGHGAAVEAHSSTVSGNSAGTDGGGIYVGDGGDLTMVNSTVSGNSTDGHGGGVALLGDDNTADLDSVTVAYNTADLDGDNAGDGGGIYRASSAGTFSVTRSIVAPNQDASQLAVAQDPDCSGDFYAGGLNLIGIVDSGCTGFGSALQLTGVPGGALDPLLSPLADNGGPTLTHAPAPASPAVDYQFSTTCPLSVDQRGVARPQGDGNGDSVLECDLGAYEVGTCPSPVVVPLSITRGDNDVELSWADDPANREYVVHRSTNPFHPFPDLISITVHSTSYIDYGAVGDPQMNYFYGVVGENACGDQSALSNKVGEFDFGITPGGNRLKFTMIALPLEGADLPTNADEAATYIDPGGGIRVVAKWQPLTRSFLVRRVGSGFPPPPFDVFPGEVLFVGADDTAPDSFAWVGDVPTAGSVTNTLYTSAHYTRTANAIIVPLDQSGHFTPTALGLSADIGGSVIAVAEWNRHTQRWVIRTARLGPNFDVYPGYPYVVITDDSAPPSWP